MSKITNDGLPRSGTKCFIVVPVWQQWASALFALSYTRRQMMHISLRDVY